jgi:hypothetical protein
MVGLIKPKFVFYVRFKQSQMLIDRRDFTREMLLN